MPRPVCLLNHRALPFWDLLSLRRKGTGKPNGICKHAAMGPFFYAGAIELVSDSARTVSMPGAVSVQGESR